LVVSPAALRDAQAYVNKNIFREQEILKQLAGWAVADPLRIRSFPAFASQFLGWESGDLAGAPGGPELPKALEVPLPDYSEVLAPTYAVPDPANQDSWLMLAKLVPSGASMDDLPAEQDHRWHASAQARFERLLRENQIPIGVMCNGDSIRLTYAPRGESAGHLTFPVQAMCEVAGRPITAALHLLLSADRLFSLPTVQRLPAILQQSRKYQNEVSTKLAEQVLRALNELMRGFQAANEASHGELLGEVLRDAPSDVYGALLTTLMRLVFVLYAEDRGLLSTDPVYLSNYSISGLFERLREDAALYPDTMDQRYGAWAQIITLSRLIYDGGGHGVLHLPTRHGRLFDPDAYPFLEGRQFRTTRSVTERLTPPRVSDGIVFRVLHDLLVLDGDRLSYRSLDVEQIGSVYEAMMGFEVRTATGPSIGLRPDHVVFNLQDLLEVRPGDRNKWLKEQASCELSGKALEQLKEGGTVDDLMAALDRRRSPLTPTVIPPGAMYLQPTEERRRSGSHYTPRSLTEPIVRTTLQPVLAALGEKPRPEQILELKVCDPAMGSGAFLVESCRFLAEALVDAWSVHGKTPIMPPDQEPVLHARRLIAQRCLYGVDKNPFAVDLAKLSLWLATLAKDHPFTFLDQSLRCGDSLVGLTRQQIAAFHWLPAPQQSFLEQELRKRIDRVGHFRTQILSARDEIAYDLLRQKLDSAEDAISVLRQTADATLAAFFSSNNPRNRENRRLELQGHVAGAFRMPGQSQYEDPIRDAVLGLKAGPRPLMPFHWEIEFPEVFSRDRQGFDAIVANPPFLGGTLIGGHLGLVYHDYLVITYSPATGLADLIAFFLRRAFGLIRIEGTLGMIATNTVAQGDTRSTGLEWVLRQGGKLYQVQRRYKWPGNATVVVSLFQVQKTDKALRPLLDGAHVDRISAYLLAGTVDATPIVLFENKRICYLGTKIWGSGFVFEDPPANGSSSLAELEYILSQDARNREVIFAYLGGEDFSTSPAQHPSRFVIDFGNMSEDQARRWPTLFSIVEERVRPVRLNNKQRNYRDNWWLHANRVEGAGPYLQRHGRLLALTCYSQHHALAFVERGTIAQNTMLLFLLHEDADFAVTQSRIHEAWVRIVATTLGDARRYTTACFDTFPRPSGVDRTQLQQSGACYYDFRAHLMKSNQEGLTKTYNRFHDPEELNPEILKLRELHTVMDRAVLDAYGWTDIPTECEFLLDYEIDELEWSGRRKPYRYRWADEVRDEVVARLLELNRQRAEAEHLAGAAAENSSPKKRTAKVASKVKLKAPTLYSAEDLSE